MSGGSYLLNLSKKVTRKCEIKKGTFRLLGYVSGRRRGQRWRRWGRRSSGTPWRWPQVASEARFGTFWRNHFVQFQDLLLYFQAVFTLWHVHNRALDTNGEAAHPVSQGEAAVHSHRRLQVQHHVESQVTAQKTELRFCFWAERADNGYIWRSGRLFSLSKCI